MQLMLFIKNLDVKIKKGRGSGTEKEKEWTKVSRRSLGLGVGVNKVSLEGGRYEEKDWKEYIFLFFSDVGFGYDCREGK